MRHLAEQATPVAEVVLVLDGHRELALEALEQPGSICRYFALPKHEPGMEQPRNVGVRKLGEGVTHVAFLDSDILVGPDWHDEILAAYAAGSEDRIMVCPYDWLPDGFRQIIGDHRNDPRWEMFNQSGPERVYENDLSAGLACFSGNLVWPISEFTRVGGFWSEIHHGRCEDGELGLRAVAMGVGISFAAKARGWHLAHPVNMELALERNARDVPMLNARHPWVQGSEVFVVNRDGKAFDATCPNCHLLIPTIGWWDHAARCGGDLAIPVVNRPGDVRG